jgi:predicted hotdog family 3-hydroxylacyl-ACP dehydratase
MPDLPPIASLLPHAPPMRWLLRVTAHAGDETECEADLGALRLIAGPDGSVPAHAALELAAQCAAAHARLVASEAGPPRIGYLLGTRRFTLFARALPAKRQLLVRVRRLWGGELGAVSFDSELRDAESGDVLASGRISCFTPRP